MASKEAQIENAKTTPLSIQIPVSNMTSWQPSSADGVSSTTTPRASGSYYPMTPGMGIGVATPAISHPTHHLPGVPEDSVGGGPLTKRTSQASGSNASADKPNPNDYFGNSPLPPGTAIGESQDEPKSPNNEPNSATDTAKEGGGNSLKKSGSLFGKKFQMSSMTFSPKKLGRSLSSSTNNIEKPVIPAPTAENETKSEHSEDSESRDKSKEIDDNLYGVIQKMRHEYDRLFLAETERPFNPASSPKEWKLESGITPSLAHETPVLKLPPMTTVIIQEETSGGSADLYRGTVGTVGRKGDVELVEREAPMWLGELLLGNRTPVKEPVKVSFVLLPWKELLPGIAGADGYVLPPFLTLSSFPPEILANDIWETGIQDSTQTACYESRKSSHT